MSAGSRRLDVVVATPAHAGLGAALTYRSDRALPPGALVRVPLGRREVLGVVWGPATQDPVHEEKAIAGALDGIPPLSDAWRQLVAFSASYYQRSAGEVALAALPPQLRELSPVQWQRRLARKASDTALASPEGAPALTSEQQAALQTLHAEPGPFLLFGATGSGKTEVYLRATAEALAADPQAQVLVMVPEINLTPQLQQRFVERFGDSSIVAMHSGMTAPQRLKAWLAAHTGAARIVLGTRMAVFASMPHLKLVVDDEDHDPSYKQQEGARYSARDLGIYRGRLEGAKVLLASATPSLESWHASERGRYKRLAMPSRVGQGRLPQ
ncbi:MAG TPA: DEAD/DEAH box helicase, partial [Ramlibacter sp.]